MSAPAALVCAKILVPETESFNNKLEISKERMGSNVLEAIANGTTDGIKLAVNVAGMLLVFIALMAMMNYILHNWIGEPTGLTKPLQQTWGNQMDSPFNLWSVTCLRPLRGASELPPRICF